jgi:dTDP-4-dehydrorhamnose reductase
MKIAVTGSKGSLGKNLVENWGCIPINCDVTDPQMVKFQLHRISPDVIIHTAAQTNVDWCENNPREAFEVNVRGTCNLIDVFHEGLFIYVSSVHVFGGEKFYDYSEKHQPNPINKYGFTKWAGEAVADMGTCKTIVVRASKLFNLEMMEIGLDNLKKRIPQEYPDFITRSFTYIPHFIQSLMKLIEMQETAPPIVNIASTDTWSHANFWRMTAHILGYDEKLIIHRKKDVGGVPRPWHGGLNTNLQRNLGLGSYTTVDGLNVVKEILT